MVNIAAITDLDIETAKRYFETNSQPYFKQLLNAKEE